MIMTKNELILDFIKQFNDLGARNCFSNGMCYWFSNIMMQRFDGDIVYDPVLNHFAILIDGHVYDITGDITGDINYAWEFWEDFYYENPSHTTRILRDCRDKIPAGVITCEHCDECYHSDVACTWHCRRDWTEVEAVMPCKFGKER